MVMVTGDRGNSHPASPWFVENLESRLPPPPKDTQEAQPVGTDILWALDPQGVFTLFEPCHPLDIDTSTDGYLGRTVYDVFKACPAAVDAARGGLAGNRVDTTFDYAGKQWKIQGYPLHNANGRVSGLVGFAGIIGPSALKQTRQPEKSQFRLRQLATLHEIDRAITQNTDLEVTLNIILNHVLTQLEIDASAILLLNSSNQQMEYAVGRGFKTSKIRGIVPRVNCCQDKKGLLSGTNHGDLTKYQGRESCLPEMLYKREGFQTYYHAPLVIRGRIKGIMELFHRVPLSPDDEWFAYLDTLATQTAIAVDHADLLAGLQRSNTELTLAYETALDGWVRALDLRDEETEWHTQRVTEMTLRLAQAMNISSSEQIHIRRGALLHDIGKMGISDNILNKAGPLSEDEWEIMKRHPAYAKDLLSPISYLKPSIDIPYYHHEKWDGSGYPEGLKGTAIPLSARIFAVVDVWDALCSNRPYRSAWSSEDARRYLGRQSGKHFDPRIVEKFFELGLDR